MNSVNIPRSEYPNPQFRRSEWLNLNGEWCFEKDLGVSGLDRGLQSGDNYSETIVVPYAPETALSGIGYRDFMPCVWYSRTVSIPENWNRGHIFVTFGAVDYFAELYIGGKRISYHRGTSAPFVTDITDYVTAGNNVKLVLRVTDDTRSGKQTGGKQSYGYNSQGCHYTRTTGIWQTVWLEYVPAKAYIRSFRIIPDVVNKRAVVTVAVNGLGGKISAAASLNGKEASKAESKVSGMSASLILDFDEVELWDLGKGTLYDLRFDYESESGIDTVYSYFGMRSVELSDNALILNGRPIYQRLVLDQGFYPDGSGDGQTVMWTAPTDEDLIDDITLSLRAGFNGARLHQKVFEPRFLYHADRLGYIVWGENASWGMNQTSGEAYEGFMGEWHEILTRDFNHPSIIGWCPFNETSKSQRDVALLNVYEMTKNFDPTRPVIDTSGYVHVKTDIFDIHDYEQNPDVFIKHFEGLGDKLYNHHDINMEIPKKAPYFVSEYGGTWWNEADAKAGKIGWGYGQRPQNIEEVYTRIEKLTKILLDNENICAFCYTQLTDIFPEQNGIYYLDRSCKYDMDRIHAIFSSPAAIENKKG